MAGPLKRTGYRSSPEDEALFRKFHDSALAAFHEGRSREEVAQQLVGQGVPAETAERIAWAVNHEVTQAAFKPSQATRPLRWTLIVCGFFIVCIIGVVAWRMIRHGATMGALAGLFIALIVSAIVIGRLLRKIKGPPDLTTKRGP